jgi:hypothetical protein
MLGFFPKNKLMAEETEEKKQLRKRILELKKSDKNKIQKIFYEKQEIYDSKTEQYEKCSICLEHIKSDNIKTHCNHHFHKTCLDNFYKSKQERNEYNQCIINTCPQCRKTSIKTDWINERIKYKYIIDNKTQINIGENVKAILFGNIIFKVTSITKVYLCDIIEDTFGGEPEIIKCYKKFYNGLINNYIHVSFQRKDIRKINIPGKYIYCFDCNKQSITNNIIYDKEVIDDGEDYYYLLNDENDINDSNNDEDYKYEKLNECKKCFSFNTNKV